MENSTMIIKKNDEKNTLDIQIKFTKGKLSKEQATQDTYSSIVTILEWTEKVNGVDAQAVLDALKSKNFVGEHYYNPVM